MNPHDINELEDFYYNYINEFPFTNISNTPQTNIINNYLDTLHMAMNDTADYEDEEENVDETFPISNVEHLLNTVYGNNGSSIIITTNAHNLLSNRLAELFESFMTNIPTHEQTDVPLPMTQCAFDAIPEKIFSNAQKENESISDTCAICQEKYTSDSAIKILSCNHVLHKECASEWLLKHHHLCPLCRHDCGEHVAMM